MQLIFAIRNLLLTPQTLWWTKDLNPLLQEERQGVNKMIFVTKCRNCSLSHQTQTLNIFRSCEWHNSTHVECVILV